MRGPRFPTSASAKWYEARTNHFLLTINESKEKAKAFAERLERFDGALRRLYGVADDPDQHLRPLAIYAFRDRLFLDTCNCTAVLGYYQPHVKQSLIVSLYMPEADAKAPIGGWSSQTLLLHEYSHHFAFNNFPIAYPKWFTEGFAEFNATAGFEPDGSVIIGYPANYRAEAIFHSDLSLYDIFDSNSSNITAYNLDSFYGRAWLLTHYLMLNHSREGQLARYMDLVNRGNTPLHAAQIAFGDLKTLDRELKAYSHKIAAQLKIPPSATPITVTLRDLSPGEAAMIPPYARMRSGIPQGHELGVALEARGIAHRYPDDPRVQAELAEIEYATDRPERASEAADAALHLAPGNVDALVVKGMAATEQLSEAKSTDAAAWQEARQWFLKANHAEPNDVMPLFEYYASFVREGSTPSPGAVQGLMRAAVLAPEAAPVRLLLARQDLVSDDARTARSLLEPLAFSPHAPRADNVPLDVIQLIDARQTEKAKELITTKIKEDLQKSD